MRGPSIDKPLERGFIDRIVEAALTEDLGAAGDVTTGALVPPERTVRGVVLAKSPGVLCGMALAEAVYGKLGSVDFSPRAGDGDRLEPGRVVADVEGAARSILAGERTALNFLQHLSGIATLTRQFVDVVQGRTRVYDTRKTLPGLRPAAKYAVRVGGGRNHRHGLYDAVLIKDNHLALAGGLASAVERARQATDLEVEVEVESWDQLEEAVISGADVIMLDNWEQSKLEDAVGYVAGRAVVEASGGITLDNVERYASSGVDRISTGAVTLAAPPLDFSLELEVE